MNVIYKHPMALIILLLGTYIEDSRVNGEATVVNCQCGYAFAASFTDGSFQCKPPPSKCQPTCSYHYRNITESFFCPDFGYSSGWLDTFPTAWEICCTVPGLYYSDVDCISYEYFPGNDNTVPSDRYLVGAYSANGGQSFIDTACRYNL